MGEAVFVSTAMVGGMDAQTMLSGLVAAARLTVPDDVAQLAADQGRALGAQQVTVYLLDVEQYVLVPLPMHDAEVREPLSVDATLAGRCVQKLEAHEADGGRQVWIPLVDGLKRLGVLHLVFAAEADRASEQELHAFAALLAEIVVVKNAYGDLFRSVRRRQPMSLAAEVAWHLLPPLTFGTDRLVISCVLAPAYDVGGDCFDYSVGDRRAHFAIFDAMGHGLSAGWLATVAIAAYRNSRRAGRDFRDTLESIDRAVRAECGPAKFVTAVLAELDLASGDLRWHLAGHPAPLLIRSGRVVASLSARPGLPLGLGGARDVSDTTLEPADRLLLFTDGVTEARSADGEFFGDARLADLVIRETSAGQPAPETLRRLMHALLKHRTGHRDDDATAMFVEWRGGGANRITP